MNKNHSSQGQKQYDTISPAHHSNRVMAPESQRGSGTTTASDSIHEVEIAMERASASRVIRYRHMSGYPRALDSTESILLDHYVQRFSREYPTCSGPNNPFLSVFLPLAMRNGVVLDSLLALSGAQHWDHGCAWIEKESLKLRQRALRGTRALLAIDNTPAADGNMREDGPRSQSALAKPNHTTATYRIHATNEETLLYLLTSSVLFLLYEKVSGEPSWRPHIEFINQFFEHSLSYLTIDPTTPTEVGEAVKFLFDIFVYNDLVRSTSLQAPTLSSFYLTAMRKDKSTSNPLGDDSPNNRESGNGNAMCKHRHYFPNLIARLSAGDDSVTEAEIAAWDGSLEWLPSFALDTRIGHETFNLNGGLNAASLYPQEYKWDDRKAISELYRTAASVYRLQALSTPMQDRMVQNDPLLVECAEKLAGLALRAHSLMLLLSEGSIYENALLWPIGIAAKELTQNQTAERQDVLARLQYLNKRFQMRHFGKVQEILLRHWMIRDKKAIRNPHTSFKPVRELETILVG